MARNKHPEVTVNRILDTALKLFLKKGYEETTIQDIVDHLGDLSKGAIYHHFRSKEEIISAVTNRMVQQQPLNQITEDHSLTGLQKLKKVFVVSLSNSEQRQLYRSASAVMKNPKFLSEQLNEYITVQAPQLQKMIREGVEDGSIASNPSKELSEVVILLFNVWLNPGLFAADKEQFTNKFFFLKRLLDHLGVPVIDQEISDAFKDFCDGVFA
ncbi:TetR/AcrR family transcriptional regulator [Sporolactobacillus shoreicorticis]|uniref:TetR/AcrR family transcriptional regulator n=1 Tax=Sporolactobacillus shoreicorticis TaxID=1923877 RepID=A0ABW5S0I5_9BACL|nr:TetR/AcrR family transcriptional regulator [Sporolactobacillus shoreicorticis]MCO7124578.1 TetR/AcrR family transcriptional regulator [Sporolactobacillus shoreicorticis]